MISSDKAIISSDKARKKRGGQEEAEKGKTLALALTAVALGLGPQTARSRGFRFRSGSAPGVALLGLSDLL